MITAMLSEDEAGSKAQNTLSGESLEVGDHFEAPVWSKATLISVTAVGLEGEWHLPGAVEFTPFLSRSLITSFGAAIVGSM